MGTNKEVWSSLRQQDIMKRCKEEHMLLLNKHNVASESASNGFKPFRNCLLHCGHCALSPRLNSIKISKNTPAEDFSMTVGNRRQNKFGQLLDARLKGSDDNLESCVKKNPCATH